MLLQGGSPGILEFLERAYDSFLVGIVCDIAFTKWVESCVVSLVPPHLWHLL